MTSPPPPYRRLFTFILITLCLISTHCTLPQSVTKQIESSSPSQTSQSNQSTHQTLHGQVVKILDGDTIEILDPQHKTLRIRFQGIDAPEKTQAFGNRARQELSNLIFNQDVTLEISDHDIYGRTIAKVIFNNKDIGLQLIQRGLAWHFKRYAQNQTETDRFLYSKAEEKSRQQKLGLWADLDPIAPWQYRREK